MKNTTTIKRTESLAIQALVSKAIYVTPQCSITGFKLGQKKSF